MAGLIKRFTQFFTGEGEEEKFNTLLEKIDQYSCDHVKLYCSDPLSGAKISIYSKARASLRYNESNGKFSINLKTLAEIDEDEEDEVDLPIFKGIKWNLDEPTSDEDNFIVKHYFDYTGKKDLKNVGGGRYQVDFTLDAKTNEVDNFENYINDILDVVEAAEEAAEEVSFLVPNSQAKAQEATDTAEEEEKKEFSDSLFEGEGTLFEYNLDEDRNDVVQDGAKFLIQNLEGEFKYAFTVLDTATGEILVQTTLHGETQASIKKENNVVMWIHDTNIPEGEEMDAFVFYFLHKTEKDIENLSN